MGRGDLCLTSVGELPFPGSVCDSVSQTDVLLDGLSGEQCSSFSIRCDIVCCASCIEDNALAIISSLSFSDGSATRGGSATGVEVRLISLAL